MSIPDEVRGVFGTDFPKGSGVNQEVIVTVDKLKFVSVVLSSVRSEIWLAPPLVPSKLIIKAFVNHSAPPREVILAIINLKAAQKEFGLWIVDIEGELAHLGHLVVW